jgi:hypothetical protein
VSKGIGRMKIGKPSNYKNLGEYVKAKREGKRQKIAKRLKIRKLRFKVT